MFSLFLDSAQQDPHADTTDVTDEAEATLVLHRARSFNKLRQGAWSMGGVNVEELEELGQEDAVVPASAYRRPLPKPVTTRKKGG